MIDVIKALLYIKPSTGTRMGIMALTGGQSVVAADAYAKAGLDVPLLTERSYEELATFFSVIGASYRNPFDVSSNSPSLEMLARLLEILERDENVDAAMAELSTSMLGRREALDEGYTSGLLDLLARHCKESSKPFYTTVIPVDQEVEALRLRDTLMEKGIPSFPSFSRSANAYKKAVGYHQFRKG
jgi:acyl-CoA synthetase (NDP forming)